MWGHKLYRTHDHIQTRQTRNRAAADDLMNMLAKEQFKLTFQIPKGSRFLFWGSSAICRELKFIFYYFYSTLRKKSFCKKLKKNVSKLFGVSHLVGFIFRVRNFLYTKTNCFLSHTLCPVPLWLGTRLNCYTSNLSVIPGASKTVKISKADKGEVRTEYVIASNFPNPCHNSPMTILQTSG